MVGRVYRFWKLNFICGFMKVNEEPVVRIFAIVFQYYPNIQLIMGIEVHEQARG